MNAEGKAILDRMQELQIYRAEIESAKATAHLVGAKSIQMADRNGWDADDVHDATQELMDAADKVVRIIRDWETLSAIQYLGAEIRGDESEDTEGSE